MLAIMLLSLRVRPKRVMSTTFPRREITKVILSTGHRDVENIVPPDKDVSIVGC
jgi:hypothetical protein